MPPTSKIEPEFRRNVGAYNPVYEKVIPFKGEIPKPKLVVNSIFNSEVPWAVHVGTGKIMIFRFFWKIC